MVRYQCSQYTVRDLGFQYISKYSARQFSAMAIYNNNIGIKKSKYTWGFNRVTAWGKKLTLCRLVLANIALYRLPEGRRLNSFWLGCEGSRVIFAALFLTRLVQDLDGGKVSCNDLFRSPYCPLQSCPVPFGGWPKPDSDRGAEDRLNDGWVEGGQQLFRQIKLPELSQEV